MTTIGYIAIILVQVGVIVYFIQRGKQKNAATPADAVDSFDAKRQHALQVSASQLKLNIPPGQLFVYGLVMDWNMGTEKVTLAAYITGAANLYLGTGGGASGAGARPNVGLAAAELVNAAQDFALRAVPAMAGGFPAEGCVRFNLLTSVGLLAAQEHVQHFDDGSSPWLALFEQGNNVIAEMRVN